MVDEHLTPVLEGCSDAELALLLEFLGRPPSGLFWFDRRIRDLHAGRAELVAAIVERMYRLGGHSVLGRTHAGEPSYLQIVCDALAEMQLPEEPAAGGIAELELRIVRYALDADFDRLPASTQQSLLGRFFSGEAFADGVPDLSMFHDFVTHVGPGKKGVVPARAALVAGEKLRDAAIHQAGERLKRIGLGLVLRGLGGPVYNALVVWDWLGPAFRYTVPAIAYIAYLRARQPPTTEATERTFDSAPEAAAASA